MKPLVNCNFHIFKLTIVVYSQNSTINKLLIPIPPSQKIKKILPYKLVVKTFNMYDFYTIQEVPVLLGYIADYVAIINH